MVLPPQSSGIRSYSESSCFTLSMLALGLSILFTATIISTPAAFAWLIASTVCGMTPSSAATTSIAISVDCAPRILIAVNASCPGVSRKVIGCPLILTIYAPICCVIPPASWLVTSLFLIASKSEVLPWSTCPITQTTGGLGKRSASFSASSLRSSSITSTFSSILQITSYSKAISSASAKLISVLRVTICPFMKSFLIIAEDWSLSCAAKSFIVSTSGMVISLISSTTVSTLGLTGMIKGCLTVLPLAGPSSVRCFLSFF